MEPPDCQMASAAQSTSSPVSSPLSPARSGCDLESAPSTPGLDNIRRSSTITKSTNTPEKPRNLITLPDELQVIILEHLGFADIERLRRTCKYWHSFASQGLVRSIWGPDTYRTMLIRHCKVCLTYCPSAITRMPTRSWDAGYPLSSRCVKCTVQSHDGTVRIGSKTLLGNLVEYWTCRWCGFPVTKNSSDSSPEFHLKCHISYSKALLTFFLLGWVQVLLGVSGSGLCWRYFRGDRMVLAPTIVGFLLMWACAILILLRGHDTARTYHVALFLEAAIMGLWIPPAYSISKGLGTDKPSASTIATLVPIGFNMLFRFINAAGNIVLITDYDRTRHYVPYIPLWRRFINPIPTALIFWTYPKHIERRSPPG